MCLSLHSDCFLFQSTDWMVCTNSVKSQFTNCGGKTIPLAADALLKNSYALKTKSDALRAGRPGSANPSQIAPRTSARQAGSEGAALIMYYSLTQCVQESPTRSLDPKPQRRLSSRAHIARSVLQLTLPCDCLSGDWQSASILQAASHDQWHYVPALPMEC